jgi:hypothetical protein
MLARFAIALLLLLPSWVSARAEYFCRPLQRVVSSSCCPGASAARQRPPSAAPQLRAEDCCERLPSAAATPVPATRSESDRVQAPLASSVGRLPVRAALPERATSQRSFERSRAARVHGPPLFITNCAMLN